MTSRVAARGFFTAKMTHASTSSSTASTTATVTFVRVRTSRTAPVFIYAMGFIPPAPRRRGSQIVTFSKVLF